MAVQVVGACQLDQLKQLEHGYSQLACIEKFVLSTHLLQHLLHFLSSGLGVLISTGLEVLMSHFPFNLFPNHAQTVTNDISNEFLSLINAAGPSNKLVSKELNEPMTDK